MKRRRRKLLKEYSFDDFKSQIPKHLTPEERESWEKELAWEWEEIKRRKREGYYPHQYHNLED